MRNSYKYPLLVGLPEIHKKNLPLALSKNDTFLNILTGVSVAFIESIITCPIERTKVFLMT
jgi:hypothetical protein